MSARVTAKTWVGLALVLILGAPREASAWSCWTPTLEERVEAAALVFKGQVVSHRTPWLLQPVALAALPEALLAELVGLSGAHVVTEVRVLAAWKGVERDAVLLHSDPPMLGTRWSAGQELLVFVDESAWVGPCNAPLSEELEQRGAELDALLGPPTLGPWARLPLSARFGWLEWGSLVAMGLALLEGLRRLARRRR